MFVLFYVVLVSTERRQPLTDTLGVAAFEDPRTPENPLTCAIGPAP